MTEKELICVCCPMGCRLTVRMEDGHVLSVSGNSCPRGRAYGEQECIRPMRILTTTVRIHGGIHRVLPVMTEGEIPLDQMRRAMDEVRTLSAEAPVHAGQVIAENIAGTGVRLVASRSMDRVSVDNKKSESV